jgi:hypothetical protein
MQVDSDQLSGFLWPAEGAAPFASVFFIHKTNTLDSGLGGLLLLVYGGETRKYLVRERSFVRFTNSDSFLPTEGRIRGQTMQRWSQSRSSVLQKSREGLIVGRKEELDNLIAAFDRLMHRDHPNHERVNCPGQPALTRLANKPEAFGSDSILDHIRQCAACLDELKDLRLSIKRPQ